MKSPKKLAEINEKLTAKLSKRYSKKLVDLLPFFLQYMRENKLNDGLLAPLALTRQSVSLLLIQAGLPLWSRFNDELEEVGQQAIKNLNDQGFDVESFSPSGGAILSGITDQAPLEIRDAINAAREKTAENLGIQMNRISDELILGVKTQLEQMQVVPVSLAQASAELSARFSVARGQAKTLVNTALAAVQREINVQVGTRLESIGVDVYYVYQGGIVDDTRDFCKKHNGKAYTKKQIGKMSNGQGLNVFKYGGGYNCRHSWFAMSKGAIEAANIEVG